MLTLRSHSGISADIFDFFYFTLFSAERQERSAHKQTKWLKLSNLAVERIGQLGKLRNRQPLSRDIFWEIILRRGPDMYIEPGLDSCLSGAWQIDVEGRRR